MPCSRCGLYRCSGYSQHMSLEDIKREVRIQQEETDKATAARAIIWTEAQRREYKIKKLETELEQLKSKR